MQHKYISLTTFPFERQFMIPTARNNYTMLKFNEDEQKQILIPNKDRECFLPINKEFMVIKKHVIVTDRASMYEVQRTVDMIMSERYKTSVGVFNTEFEAYNWIRTQEFKDMLDIMNIYIERSQFVMSEEFDMSQPWKGRLENYKES